MSISHWQRRNNPDQIRADLVILGAGITGLSAAIEAQRRGLRCVIVEKRTPGIGASGRNAGYLMRGMAENYSRVTRELGRDRARAIWSTSEGNLADLRAIGLEALPSFRPTPSCIVAASEQEAADLTASVPLLAEDGFEATLLHTGDDGACDDLWSHAAATARDTVALVNPHDATVNPAELVAMLRRALTTTMVLECSEAYAVALDEQHRVTVRTPTADITAARGLVALNAYAGELFPGLVDLAVPNRGQMLRLSPTEPDVPLVRLDHAYYVNAGGEYLRLDDHGHVIMGGCRARHADAERTSSDAVTDAVQADLEAAARALLGPALDHHTVTARWAGTMGFSPDGLPVTTPISADGTPITHDAAHATNAETSPLWFCGGFTGHGMSLAHRTAVRTLAAMLGETAPLFPASRFDAMTDAMTDPMHNATTD
jgi:gamma-glutamylputrescine oxidase